jgi:hypothetical protein
VALAIFGISHFLEYAEPTASLVDYVRAFLGGEIPEGTLNFRIGEGRYL